MTGSEGFVEPTDDRIKCRWCIRYDPDEFRCHAAKPPLARLADLRHRCEGFTAHDPAKRTGAQRWPDLIAYPGGPGRKPYPERAK